MEGVNQLLSHYQQVLDQLEEKNKQLASKYIPQLYFILKEEEQRSLEECRSKIESDCNDIWSKETIRKYLPPEAKNETKRKAGKISAEVTKRRKAKEAKAEEEEAKPLIVNSGINGSGSTSGQTSVLIHGRGRGTSDEDNNNDNSVGMNPTENGSVGQKKQESSTFQTMKNNPDSNFRDEDLFPLPLVERLKDEALQEFEDRIPIEGFKTDLELQVEVGTRDTVRVLEKQVNDLEVDLRNKRSQLDQLDKEIAMREKRYTQLQYALDSYNNKFIKGTTQIEFGSEFLPVNIEYNFTTCQFSARIPEKAIERLLRAIRRHG
jgi:hypothetical protein